MAIKFKEVTWYSKLLAAILFIAIPFVAFCFGVQWGRAKATIVLRAQQGVQAELGGATANSAGLHFSFEECSGCAFKTLKEATSGFQMKVPAHWGDLKVAYNANAGDRSYADSEDREKSYADPLYLPAWLVPKAQATFSHITSSDVYEPKIYVFDKTKFQYSWEMANFVKEMADKSDTMLMARNRDDFFRANGCGGATMFWSFGYCDNKFITPMLLNSDPIILGFEQGSLATDYGYAYLVDGKNYWILVAFESNDNADFFKKYIQGKSISAKASYVNIVSAKKSDVQVSEDYPSTMLGFLKTTDDDKYTALKEIETIVNSIRF